MIRFQTQGHAGKEDMHYAIFREQRTWVIVEDKNNYAYESTMLVALTNYDQATWMMQLQLQKNNTFMWTKEIDMINKRKGVV